MRRLVIFLWSLGWGWLVYALHRKIGCDSADGFPPMAVSLTWAVSLALPLFIGSIFVNSREGWRRCILWGCAGLMAAEAAAVLIFFWAKIFAMPPIIGVVLLMGPETKDEFPPASMRQRLIRSGLWLVGGSLLVWWFWFHNPLSSDREMLQHFTVHRAELEQLVQGYRNYRRSDAPEQQSYMLLEDVKALKQKAEVYSITGAQGAAGRWYPDHYSEHTLQVRKSLEIRSASNPATEAEIMKTLRHELPTLFEGGTPVRDLLDKARVTTVIDISLGSLKKQRDRIHLRYGLIHKGYYYFPQPPRIENGHIVEAGYSLIDHAYTRPGQRVLESLDDFPPDWKRGECVLKPIDGRWFITLCRSY
ncbi:MAG: hypothetical protein ACOY3Z_05700 [Thermodesulfobacteriota bacterium]